MAAEGEHGKGDQGVGGLLFLDEITDALLLAERAQDYRVEYHTVRPHEAIAWNRPQQVHLGPANPTNPTFQTKETLPTS